MEATITKADDYKAVTVTGHNKCWMGAMMTPVETVSDEVTLQREIDELKALMEECEDGHDISRWISHNGQRVEKQKKLDKIRWQTDKIGVR